MDIATKSLEEERRDKERKKEKRKKERSAIKCDFKDLFLSRSNEDEEENKQKNSLLYPI